jgi:hypothetical protein
MKESTAKAKRLAALILGCALAAAAGCAPAWHSGDRELRHCVDRAAAYADSDALWIQGSLNLATAVTDYGVRLVRATDNQCTTLTLKSARIFWQKEMRFELELTPAAPTAKEVLVVLEFTSRSGTHRLSERLNIERNAKPDYRHEGWPVAVPVSSAVVRLHTFEAPSDDPAFRVVRVQAEYDGPPVRLVLAPLSGHGPGPRSGAIEDTGDVIELPSRDPLKIELRHSPNVHEFNNFRYEFRVERGPDHYGNFRSSDFSSRLRTLLWTIEPETELRLGDEKVIYDLALTDKSTDAPGEPTPVAWLRLKAYLEPSGAKASSNTGACAPALGTASETR